MPKLYKAAIFDFDGVIVDSGPLHERAWNEVARERQQSITHEIFLNGFGVKNDLFIRDMLCWSIDPDEIAHIIDRKEALFQSYLLYAAIHPVEGIRGYLEHLKACKVPCALGSSSIRKNIDLVLHKVSLESYFGIIISGENVSVGKPDPDVFLKAAKGLHVAPECCCVFEDAPLGVEAGFRAGMGVVAITTTFPDSQFQKMNPSPLYILESFSDVKPIFINESFS